MLTEAIEEISTLAVGHLQLILIIGNKLVVVTVQCIHIKCITYTGDLKCSGQMTLTTESGWQI